MKRLAWWALPIVILVALVVGARPQGRDSNRDGVAARANAIAETVRCPTCRGLSAADSNAKTAEAIRAEIGRRVRAGETDAEVRAYLVSRYGPDILLRPEADGVGAVVWALPAGVVVLAGAGLIFAVRRWRRESTGPQPGGPTRSVPRIALGGALTAALAVGAGVAVASTSGERVAGEPATGSIETVGAAADLARARELVADGNVLDAVKLYDEVLRRDPDNPEALAQRGWLLSRTGASTDPPNEELIAKGLDYVERALAVDSDHAEALFFKGMILFADLDDPAGAVESFRAFLATDPPDGLREFVESELARAEAAAQQRRAGEEGR